MSVVYNCHVPEVMGYPVRGYCFRRGGDVFLMWEGYLHELMRAMWDAHEYEPDSASPGEPQPAQVPLLQAWNEGGLAADGPVSVGEPAALALAFRAAVSVLRRGGSLLDGTPEHGAALAAFLTGAADAGQSVTIEEWWD